MGQWCGALKKRRSTRWPLRRDVSWRMDSGVNATASSPANGASLAATYFPKPSASGGISSAWAAAKPNAIAAASIVRNAVLRIIGSRHIGQNDQEDRSGHWLG